jgi:acetyl esterase
MLHPQARAALAEAAEREDYLVPGRPDFDLARTRAELRSCPGPCEGVTHVADVDADGVTCRLFRPDPGTPVVLYLHGGGWALGSVEEAEPLCRRLANSSGWAVLAVDYRLAPEHPYPAAIEDVERAVAWLERHGAALGVDASRLALAGDSAGANLGAAVALRARDRGAPTYRLQALLYPVLDLVDEAPSRTEFAEGFGLDRATVRWHVESYAPGLADRRRPDISPLRAASLEGLPPAVVVTAEYDPLRDEGEEYAARLADAGVPVVATRYLGMIHGFADLTKFDAARDLIDQVAAALCNV